MDIIAPRLGYLVVKLSELIVDASELFLFFCGVESGFFGVDSVFCSGLIHTVSSFLGILGTVRVFSHH